MDTQTRRVVAVTGANRGLGLLTVRALLERGDEVIAHHRTDSTELGALREKFGERLHAVRGDLTEETTAQAVAERAHSLGRLHAVVHNAGIARDQPLVRMPVEDWDEVIRVNLRSAFLVTKHAVRMMMRKRYGRLVYVSSLSAVVGNAGQSAYAASKAGLHGLSQTTAQEYARYGIRTVVVAPGFLDTGLTHALPDSVARAKAGRSLLGMGSAESVAATVAFLAGPGADNINATVVHSDGGIAF
ncbi:SDR family NAD(P)-dependent oxidoreductase [Streptomyces avermitilis]|uniref:SDR family NAD(P)-dependent oxidoreductase n=1 Tax=Streptomyces avermitilis TaxID=33903 RepID=UPI0033D24CF4